MLYYNAGKDPVGAAKAARGSRWPQEAFPWRPTTEALYTVLYYTILYDTVLYCTVLYHNILYSTRLY